MLNSKSFFQSKSTLPQNTDDARKPNPNHLITPQWCVGMFTLAVVAIASELLHKLVTVLVCV